DGMFTSCLVCAELGKNLPCGPSPSPFIASGGITGLVIRFAFCHLTSRVHHVPAATAAVKIVSAANPSARRATPSPSQPLDASHDVASKSTPRTHNAMCAYNQALNRNGVPILINISPRIVPAAKEIHPSLDTNDSFRSTRAK